MFQCNNPNISIALTSDAEAIKNLLNASYRGDLSRQGWTTEADLIAGEIRADDATMQQVMLKEGSVFLKYVSIEDLLFGCVNLQKHGTSMYLGMFSVWPHMQNAGIGKQLLLAAEEYTLQQGCSSIYLLVISVRTELIDWYKRHGYRDIGERKLFNEDGISGKHLQLLEFMTLEKAL